MDPQKLKYFTYIKPVLRNKNTKTYATLVFSLITISIFAYFAVKPTLATIISLQKSISEQKIILEQLNTKADNLSLGRRNYQNINTETKTKIDNLIPDTESLPVIISNLALLARAHQSSVSAIQFQTTQLTASPKTLSKNATLQQIEFTLSLQGTYQNLVNFLNNLPKTTRLINIDSFSFNKNEDNPLTLVINGQAFYLKN